MTGLVWSEVGKRYYEKGVDRGVLFVRDLPGVVWNGLVSVTENSSEGEIRAFYFDGVKYLIFVTGEEFSATIEAITYPDEFYECDGVSQIHYGLFGSQQRRTPFALSYRTRIGNDVDGLEHAYKLHLVYGAVVSPAQKAYSTASETTDVSVFSWEITTKPVRVPRHRPTAHFIIDSRQIPWILMQQIEDILYGRTGLPPRIPSVAELLELFANPFVDGGFPTDMLDVVYDGGFPSSVPTETLDGGLFQNVFLDGGSPVDFLVVKYDAVSPTSSPTLTLDGGAP